MSADAQPRKRKDKKKKKDERELLSEKVPATPPPTMTPPSTPTGNPSADEVMHIYKEGHVGGSAVTKLLFFGIMTGLAITISVVMMSSPTRDMAAEMASKGEDGAVESAWSLDLGLGEWSPFSFGPDEGHEEAHGETPGHGEEHEGGTEEHAEEEHGEHEHSHEEPDEGGILSWLGFGGAPSSGEHEAAAPEEEHGSEEHAEEPAGEGLGSWFGWGGSEEPAAEEEPAEETSSSWFGWGSTEPSPEEPAAEEPVEEPSEEVITKPTLKSKSKEKADVEEEKKKVEVEQVQEDKEDEDEKDQADDDDKEEADDDKTSRQADDDKTSRQADEPEDNLDDDDDDDDDELSTFLRSLDLEPNLKRDSRAHIQQERAREQNRIERERQERLREIRAREDREREERLRELRAREIRQRGEERLREMRIREEQQRIEQARVERVQRELRAREERLREERAREEKAREERAREERAREEKAREERAREERAREERARVERAREERAREEREREERAREELAEEEEEASQEQEDETEPDEEEVVQVSRKKSVKVEDDDELFPEAAEALRLEQTSQAEEEERPAESQTDDAVEEAPFSRDDMDDDIAQGEEEEEEEEEIIEEKVVERKVKGSEGSAAAKASEFLAERAAERATRETKVPMREQPPLNFPPPPSLTPEPSDEEEEELSEPELGYSEGEDIVEEESEDEKLGDRAVGDSPLGSDIEPNLEGSEPELDDEEEEEELSDDDIPPPAVVKKTTPSSKERNSGPQAYEHDDITDDYDWAIKEELDLADEEFRRNPSGCLHMYQTLQAKHDNSARARVGVAKCLDSLSKEASSNRLLEFAIYAYRRALKLPLKDKLFLDIAQTLVARLRFRGFIDQTMEVHKMLISRFKDDPKHRNDLAISYLMINNLKEAGRVLNETLMSWPGNAVARTHYGLTLKLQGKHEESIAHLETGLQLDPEATKDARFYFHLGDALVRTDRPHRAEKIYEKGVTLGLFRSKYQRSLYNVDRLKAQPWWTFEQTTYSAFFRKLESMWKAIKEEGVRAIQYKKGFLDEAESLRDTGDWKQFELYARGVRNADNCNRAKITCQLIEEFEAARGCRRGQAKFSIMEGGTHVWPHCGPTNCRLRAHLGLVVPPGPEIRVANQTRTWEEGKVIIFDDSFEHEVWHKGTESRLVLIVDVWHPELTAAERKSLSPI